MAAVRARGWPERVAPEAPLPMPALRRAYLICTLAYAASKRAVEPLHGLLAALARMDGAGENFTAMLHRLGGAVSARTAHRHLGALADQHTHEHASGKGLAIPLDNWVMCALDNLDWTSKSRRYGFRAVMAHSVTSIIVYGLDHSLPAPRGAALVPERVPAPTQHLLHQLTDAEKEAYAAYRGVSDSIFAELVSAGSVRPQRHGPRPTVQAHTLFATAENQLRMPTLAVAQLLPPARRVRAAPDTSRPGRRP
jgi:hypothetical protein